MSASTWFLIGMACAVPFALILLRANGDDTDADEAADSMRQSLDADSRLDELHSYTHPRVKAITEVRK